MNHTTTTPSREATKAHIEAGFAEWLRSTDHIGEVDFTDSWRPHSNGKDEYRYYTASFGDDGRAIGEIRSKGSTSGPRDYWYPTFTDEDGNPDPGLLLPEWFVHLPVFRIPHDEAPILVGPELRHTEEAGFAVATVTARPTKLFSPFSGACYPPGTPKEYHLLIELRGKRYSAVIGASQDNQQQIPPCGMWGPVKCLLHLEPVHMLETDRQAFRLLAIEDGGHVAEELRG